MNADAVITPPSVSWAQRSGRVFLTFNVECEKPDINIEKKRVLFKGICEPEHKLHEVVIPLYGEINTEKSSFVNKGRLIEVILAKENPEEPFWPSLTSDKKKHHWLKVNFERWQDEDESGDDMDDMNDMFSSKIGDLGEYAEDEKEETSSAEEEDLPDVQ